MSNCWYCCCCWLIFLCVCLRCCYAHSAWLIGFCWELTFHILQCISFTKNIQSGTILFELPYRCDPFCEIGANTFIIRLICLLSIAISNFRFKLSVDYEVYGNFVVVIVVALTIGQMSEKKKAHTEIIRNRFEM